MQSEINENEILNTEKSEKSNICDLIRLQDHLQFIEEEEK